MSTNYDVCMIGLGPVGTVSGACFAKQGFRVIGVDIDAKRVQAICDSKPPFVEPGIAELIAEVTAAGRLTATQDIIGAIQQSRIVMIAVGTPTPEGKAPDLQYLHGVAKQIGEALRHMTREIIVVIRSTVPPGTIRGEFARIIETISGRKAGKDFHLASNPEFLREGCAIKDFFKTGRVIVGADEPRIAEEIEALYRDVDAGARLRVTIESAEFAKYVDNTWHALKVSFANEIGRVCLGFGGNPEETTEIFLSDDRLNISKAYLRPGFAFGGSCLPKDTRGLAYLAETLSVNVPVVNAILPSNDAQIKLGLSRIMEQHPRHVALLGVAFKEHVDDLRESPALAVASALIGSGIKLLAHDNAFKEGDLLALPKSAEKLSITNLEHIAGWADTLVVMHRLPEYDALAHNFAKTGGHVVDITRLYETRPASAAGNVSGSGSYSNTGPVEYRQVG